MSQTTIYTCDRCKKADSSSEFLSRVSVSVAQPGYQQRWLAIPPSSEWCRACLDEVGIKARATNLPHDEPRQPAPPSLEDVIREIVRSEIQQ